MGFAAVARVANLPEGWDTAPASMSGIGMAFGLAEIRFCMRICRMVLTAKLDSSMMVGEANTRVIPFCDTLALHMTRPFSFLHIACRDASTSAATRIKSYHGIDLSER
jgi:hypothetical protein